MPVSCHVLFYVKTPAPAIPVPQNVFRRFMGSGTENGPVKLIDWFICLLSNDAIVIITTTTATLSY